MENIIKLRDITKNYGEQTVLDNINLDIEKGSMTAIVGESGSGKTTLLNIIGLLEKPDGGKLFIENEAVRDRNIGQKTRFLRTKINYLFQNFALIDNETVDYNLDIGLKYVGSSKEEKNKLKADILKGVGLEGFGKKKVFQLSGGEQQRVSIARALLKPCEIILADEPTGSLDEKNGRIVMGFLHRLKKVGKTVLIVTHNPEVAKECDHIIRIDKKVER
jgi:putative ABC transport system ATP-binding protein